MKRVKTRKLRHGDEVLFRGHVYLAYEMDCPECAACCCLYDADTGSCPGLCYRYNDDPPVVFKYCKPEGELTFSERVAVSETDFTAYQLDTQLKKM